MSMMRCDNCDRFIDTDFDSEHFEECQAVSNLKRDIEKMIERVDDNKRKIRSDV